MSSKIEEIINISEKLFTRRGIKSVSMDDISTELGVSKKTLYKYVSDKHKLVRMTLESALKRQKFHESKCNKGSNAIEDYLMVYKSVTDMIRNANFSVEFDLQKYYPDLYDKVLNLRKEKMSEGIRSNLIRGIEEGFYRPDIDVEIITRLNVLMSEGMHNYEFLNENRDQIIHIMAINFDYHMRGIVNDKGLKEYLRLKNTIENSL